MNRILLLTYARPIVPAECVIAAVNSVSAAFLGRDGVVSVTDAVKDDRACVLVLVNGPLDNVLARLPQNVAGVPVFALQSDALQPLADAPAFASAGDPALTNALASAPKNYPVNPFSLARLMTGKVAQTREELVAAFGMPLDKILAVGGPLYAPDLAAIAARYAPPSDNAQKNKKPAGAVGASGNKITPPSLNAPKSIAVRASDATKTRDWVTPVQDPAGPGHYTESEVDAEARRAMAALGVTCDSWNRMSDAIRGSRVDDYLNDRLGDAPSSGPRALAAASDRAMAIARRITARCATSVVTSARGVRDGVDLLNRMGISSVQWNDMTCNEQFAAIARINADLVPPRVTVGEMKVELWWQWRSTTVASGMRGGEFFNRYGGSEWFNWSRLGAYTTGAASVSDVRQGNVGNCFFVASLAGVAWTRPDIIAARSWDASVRAAGRSEPTVDARPSVTVTLADPRSGSNVGHAVTMSDRLPLVINSDELCDGPQPFCHSRSTNQTWSGLWEKAMRVWLAGHDDPAMVAVAPSDNIGNATSNAPLYFLNENVHPANVLAGGNGQTMIAWAGGGASREFFSDLGRALASAIGANNSMNDVWRYLDEHCDATGKASSVLITSSIPPEWSPPAGIVPWHYYTLLGIDRARRVVYLRNPWGALSPGAPSDQHGAWNGLTLGRDDGVGVVTLQSFYDNFNSVSGNWYGARRTNDYGLLNRWGFYSFARLAR